MIVPGGPSMHLTATGTEQRRALVIVWFQRKRCLAISGNGFAGSIGAPGSGVVFCPPKLPGTSLAMIAAL